MIEFKAPENIDTLMHYGWDKYIIFLGGSIEMGVAEEWQKKVVAAFKEYSDNVVLLNPRRNDWDSSWKQIKSNKKFREQVEWELTGLEIADAIFMYFDPATKSPISLLEFGLHNDSRLHVVCPTGFYRKGNVDIVCERYDIKQYRSLNSGIKGLKESIRSRS